MADVELLLKVLHRLVDEGNTVIVIEHNLSVIAEADYIVDIGPEAGAEGGEIVATGTPEEVAKNRISRTAPFLREVLKLELLRTSRAGRCDRREPRTCKRWLRPCRLPARRARAFMDNRDLVKCSPITCTISIRSSST